MKHLKKVVVFILIFAAGVGMYSFYTVNLNHNFKTVTPGKFYKSGVIPTDELASYLEKYNIKTVVDLRIDTVIDSLNPANSKDISIERDFIQSYSKDVNYVNIPSTQIPTEENLEDFYKIIDNEDNYPILVLFYPINGAIQYCTPNTMVAMDENWIVVLVINNLVKIF
jgi:hypothetical protein